METQLTSCHCSNPIHHSTTKIPEVQEVLEEEKEENVTQELKGPVLTTGLDKR